MQVLEAINLPRDHRDLLRAVLAAFLVREGANLYVKNAKKHTPLQACDSDVSTAITAFTGRWEIVSDFVGLTEYV